MNNFQNLLSGNPDQYIGYGNPNADICFVGKEATGMLPLQCGLGSTAYWMTSLPMFFNRSKEDNPADSIWKEGHTWNKYQKLYDAIYPENAAKPGTMNFEQHVFVTEMSAMPAETTAVGKNASGFDEQLAIRKQRFFAHPYFKDFKVIVLACSDYIVNFGNRREIDSLFDVTFDINGGAHEIGPQNAFWVHHSADRKRLVIHTRQLSGAVSDNLLSEMGAVIRQHLNGDSNVVINGDSNVVKKSAPSDLRIGMSMDECRNIWGNPRDVRKTTHFDDTVSEMWFYEGHKSLMFINGILKQIHE